jgi:hypothetical protein
MSPAHRERQTEIRKEENKKEMKQERRKGWSKRK